MAIFSPIYECICVKGVVTHWEGDKVKHTQYTCRATCVNGIVAHMISFFFFIVFCLLFVCCCFSCLLCVNINMSHWLRRYTLQLGMKFSLRSTLTYFFDYYLVFTMGTKTIKIFNIQSIESSGTVHHSNYLTILFFDYLNFTKSKRCQIEIGTDSSKARTYIFML